MHVFKRIWYKLPAASRLEDFAGLWGRVYAPKALHCGRRAGDEGGLAALIAGGGRGEDCMEARRPQRQKRRVFKQLLEHPFVVRFSLAVCPFAAGRSESIARAFGWRRESCQASEC